MSSPTACGARVDLRRSGTEFPGPGTIYLNQNFSFRAPVGLGDKVAIRVTVAKKVEKHHHVTLDCLCINQDGKTIIEGRALVIAPTGKVRRLHVSLPEVHLHERGAQLNDLIKATASLAPVRTAVVHPCDVLSLEGALEAGAKGLIVPVLVGPKAKIEASASEIGRDLKGIEIVDVPHSHAAAETAVAMARAGEVDMLMKGKMADRAQITGGLLDGPLAFDNAVSRSAAEAKGIQSAVAGQAVTLIVPDLEAENMVAKQPIYLAGADAAGLVPGARIPIMLTSRADGVMSRLASATIAQLFVHHHSIGSMS